MMTLILILAGSILLLFAFVVFYGAPYVPSRKRYINEAFGNLYRLDSKDVLVDFGSGDGVVLREASKRGAKSIGYELNPLLVVISKVLSRRHRNIEVRLASYWHAHLPKSTTVIYVFSVQRDAGRIERKVQEETNRLDKEIKVICYGSPLNKRPDASYQAYTLYVFRPLQLSEA